MILKFSKILQSCKFSLKAMPKAAVFLAEGTEEMEFVISVDVLRRGGIEVVVVGLPETKPIKCSRNVLISPDIRLDEIEAKQPFDVLVLPGGLGGSQAFSESKALGELLKAQEKNGGLIAAICAAPLALKSHQVGVGKAITAYPSTAETFADGQFKYLKDRVVVDGNLITSQGPSTAFDFALTILEKLQGKEKASEVAKAMLMSF